MEDIPEGTPGLPIRYDNVEEPYRIRIFDSRITGNPLRQIRVIRFNKFSRTQPPPFNYLFKRIAFIEDSDLLDEYLQENDLPANGGIEGNGYRYVYDLTTGSCINSDTGQTQWYSNSGNAPGLIGGESDLITGPAHPLGPGIYYKQVYARLTKIFSIGNLEQDREDLYYGPATGAPGLTQEISYG